MARLVIWTGPDLSQKPGAVEVGDILEVLEPHEQYGRYEVASDWYLCLDVRDLATEEARQYRNSLSATDGGIPAQLSVWSCDVAKLRLGLVTADGTYATTRARFLKAVTAKDPPGDPLWIRG
jgi:hypothetical protein